VTLVLKDKGSSSNVPYMKNLQIIDELEEPGYVLTFQSRRAGAMILKVLNVILKYNLFKQICT